MPTQPRSPSDHYQESERLLDAVEKRFTDESVELGQLYATLAQAHATLAAVPAKSLRGRHQRRQFTPPPTGSVKGAWGMELGKDDKDGDKK